MIKSLRIKNFRGIKEGHIELAPITILVGANNSGKTTILEALFLAPNPFRDVPYSVKSALEILQLTHKTLESTQLGALLHNYTANEVDIECEVDGEKNLLQFVKRGQGIIRVYTNNRSASSGATLYEFDHFFEDMRGKKALAEFSSSSTSVKGPNSHSMLMENTLLVDPRLIDLGYEFVRANWGSIVNLGITGAIARHISSAVTEKYRDITMEPFLGEASTIYVLLEDGRRIRVGDLGEGIRNYIISRILYEMEKAGPEKLKVLLWDDLESHFNPKMLSMVAEWFSTLMDAGDQVILSTHSLEATRLIASLNKEKTTIYLISLDKEGILRTKSLTLDEFEKFLEAGVDVRVAGADLL